MPTDPTFVVVRQMSACMQIHTANFFFMFSTPKQCTKHKSTRKQRKANPDKDEETVKLPPTNLTDQPPQPEGGRKDDVRNGVHFTAKSPESLSGTNKSQKTENNASKSKKAKPGSEDCEASANESNQPTPHPAWSLKKPADKREGVRNGVHFTAYLLRACERQHNMQYKRGKKKKVKDRSKFLSASGWAADSFVHQSHHISVATSISTFWCFWYRQERSRETVKQEIEMATDGNVMSMASIVRARHGKIGSGNVER